MYTASQRASAEPPWWAGNARFIDLSNTFIVAHVAQGALIMLWAGLFTLFELAQYNPQQPMYEQGLILLPHLAAEGWGVGAGGQLVDTFPAFAIGTIHIVAAGVLAFGAYFHRNRLPQSLANASGQAAAFDFRWDDPKKLGFILGHHLVILGLGALLFVAKAMFFGGLYDPVSGAVRVVSEPTLAFGAIADYRTHLFDVDNLEDLVGGHIYVAVLLLLGGTWHILVAPFNWVKQTFAFTADGILAYSLFGIALAGFAASYYCGFNTLAYPVEFYGPPLALKSAFLPQYYDPSGIGVGGFTSRTWLANAHFYLAFFFVQGSLWHFWRGVGANIPLTFELWRRSLNTARANPELPYQPQFRCEVEPVWTIGYEPKQADLPPVRPTSTRDRALYRPVHGVDGDTLTAINGVQNTLYQTTFHPQREIFYEAAATTKTPSMFGYGAKPARLYERPKGDQRPAAYQQPLERIVYEPRQTSAAT